MKTIMITAPSSNTGKTTITLGLTRAIKNRGIDISAFKTGPDFIDTKYLGIASGKEAGNMDIHLMGEEGIRDSLSMNIGEYAILEGAMGYFDGIYNTFHNSSYDISKKLNIPAILVYKPMGEMFSVIPKIKGMAEFEDSNIRGVILNQVSKEMYSLLKEQIERYIDVKVLGYLPKNKFLEIESRYLGLKQSFEGSDCEELISKAALLVEETIDVDKILELGEEIYSQPFEYPKRRNIKVAIAYDEAFNFYYNENIKLFENICEVKYFSPIRDKFVPDSDLIYIGGGYPELYREELSSNADMINSIRENANNGRYIIGEGGGLMYLCSTIEERPMCDIFKGHAIMTDKLQRFGYVNINPMKDSLLGEEETLTGHEFHRSTIETRENTIFNIRKPMNMSKFWQCGFQYKNVLGYYQHINFLGNMKSFNYLLDILENKRKG